MGVENRYILIGEAIRQARKDLGIFRYELAKRIGKSYTTVKLWETGERRIQVEELEKVAKILNKPIEYFFNFDELRTTNKTEHRSNFLELVEQSMVELEEKKCPIKMYHDENGNRAVTNINKLFTKIITNAMYSDKNIEFDKKLGGVENEKQLIDLLFENFKKDN